MSLDLNGILFLFLLIIGVIAGKIKQEFIPIVLDIPDTYTNHNYVETLT